MKKERILAAVLIVCLAVFIAGCANLKFAWSASYQTENLAADLEQARSDALARAKSVQREEAVRLSIAK